MMDRNVYNQKILEQISDQTMFCGIKESIITLPMRIEDKIIFFGQMDIYFFVT